MRQDAGEIGREGGRGGRKGGREDAEKVLVLSESGRLPPHLSSLHHLARSSQIGSTILAQAAGVPTLPWSGTGVSISFGDCNGVIPEDIYEQVRPLKGREGGERGV
jgi:hypothetical protein